MRDLLEQQILQDAKNGDTTVLAEILFNLDDKTILNSLSDVNQIEIQNQRPDLKYYYEIHVVGKNGFSTTVISNDELDDDEVVLLGYEQDKLEGEDWHFIDYIQELTYDDWNTHFNPNKK